MFPRQHHIGSLLRSAGKCECLWSGMRMCGKRCCNLCLKTPLPHVENSAQLILDAIVSQEQPVTDGNRFQTHPFFSSPAGVEGVGVGSGGPPDVISNTVLLHLNRLVGNAPTTASALVAPIMSLIRRGLYQETDDPSARRWCGLMTHLLSKVFSVPCCCVVNKNIYVYMYMCVCACVSLFSPTGLCVHMFNGDGGDVLKGEEVERKGVLLEGCWQPRFCTLLQFLCVL